MNRVILVVRFGLAFAAFCGLGELRAAEKPNIVLIVADDLRPDAVAALGNTAIRTPALDRLIRDGTTFRRATCAYPICVAARAELLTGCTAFRALVPYPNGKLNDRLPRLPEVLRAAGYRTWHVGKWHTTGTPVTRGYDATRGLFAAGGGKAPLTHPLDRFEKPVTGYVGWVFRDDDGRTHPERGVGLTPNISEAFADAAIELLGERDARPFFLHVNFTAPHDPRFTPRGYETTHAERPPLPRNFAAAHPFDHGNRDGRDELLLPRPLQAETVRDELAIYYALVSHLDAQVGRIVAELERRDLHRNTLVVFTADHGLALGSHGLTGKQNMYEHTIGVPLIVAGPSVPRDQKSDAPCYLRDLFPTLCELCGVEVPQGLDGRSLRPVLTGERSQVHDAIVGYFTDTQRMLRTERWKYVRYPQVGKEQLFDLATDADELRDLSTAAAQATTKRELTEQLDDWLRAHGDPLLQR